MGGDLADERNERTPGDVLAAIAGLRLAAAIRAAAALDVGSALESGPHAAPAIAAMVGADELGITLLLRALASDGVIRESSSDVFELGPAGTALLPAAKGGFRELIIGWAGHPAVHRALERLDASIVTGRPAFELVHDSDFFSWLATHPEEERLYQVAVGGHEREEFEVYVDDVDFTDCHVVADVGGGGGGLLQALLTRWPHLHGVLVELPTVAAAARDAIASAGFDDRIAVREADCRSDALPAADCYVFSTVIRYFTDEVALEVLRNVQRACEPGARLVLIEMPIADGPAQAPSAIKSLLEYALTGGHDRTEAEFATLVDAAGFSFEGSVAEHGPFTTFVATRR